MGTVRTISNSNKAKTDTMCYGMQSWRYHNAYVDGTTDAGESGYRSTLRTRARDLIGGRPETTRLRGRGGEVSAVRNERLR